MENLTNFQSHSASKKASIYRKSKLMTGITFIIILALATSCLNAELQIVSDIQEDFQGISKVEVNGASLEVVYIGQQGKGTVSLDALSKSNSSNGNKINFSVTGDKLIVTVNSSGGLGLNRKSEGYIYLTGPSEMEVDLEVGSGMLRAENVMADQVILSVGSGELRAKKIDAQSIRLSSSSGTLIGEELTGEVNASVSSGKMNLSQITGNLKADGSSGEMKFENVLGLVNASISSGNMEMNHIQALGRITLSSGRVVAKDAGLSDKTFLKASSGSFSIQTPSNLNAFNFDISAGSGTANVGESQSVGSLKINNGSPHTIVGDVGSGKIEIVN